MAAFADLRKTLDRIKSRTMGVFMYDPAALPGAEGEWRPFGIYQNVSMDGEPKKSDEDIASRQKVVGYLVKGGFVVQQSDVLDIAAAAGATDNFGAGGNGITIKFTEEPCAAADVDATEGFTFQNVLLSNGFTMKGKGGEQSMVTYDFQGYVPVSQVKELDTTRTLIFDV